MTEARREAPSWRPFVTMNVAESADGKIAPVDGGKVNFGSVEDRVQMEALRAEADGVLIGGGTLRTEDPPLLIRDPSVRERRRSAKGTPHPRNITVCSSLPAHLASMSFFLNPETEKLVFTTERTPPIAHRCGGRAREGRDRSARSVGPRRSRRGRPTSRAAGGTPSPAGRGRRAEFLDAPGGPGRRGVSDRLSLPLRRPDRPHAPRRRGIPARPRRASSPSGATASAPGARSSSATTSCPTRPASAPSRLFRTGSN